MSLVLQGVRDGLYTFLDNTNVIVASLTALVVLYTRSAGILYFACGAVVCSRTVKFIKRFIRQPRPLNPSPDRQKRSSYGMPSTHSAVITYFAAYTVLASLYLPFHPSLPDEAITRTAVPLIVVPWAIAIAVSRTWLGHHTWLQVAAGALHGSVFTYIWFINWVRGGYAYGRVLEQRFFPRT